MSQFITILNADADATTFRVEENASTFAGTAGHCELKLAGDGVEPIHCMFTCIDGRLTIQDWNTNGKTLLNGQPLSDESPFSTGDEVTIGGNTVVLGSEADYVSGQPCEEVADQHSSTDVALEADSIPTDDDLERELANIRTSNSQLEAEFASFDDGNEAAAVDSFLHDPFAGGDTELLRAEIENLQMELVERDQQLLTLQHQESGDGSGGDMEDTARLVTRMEELLEELQSADERLRTFEELLRTSDEATQAEQEERRQLEAWVEQIEQRVTSREDESKAEIERLNHRCRDFAAQQKHHEKVLEKAMQQRSAAGGSGVTHSGNSDELVTSLQAQVKELQTNWQQAQEQTEQLTKQLTLAAGGGADAGNVVELQQKVMELETSAARERAEMARERAELSRMQADIERQTATQGPATDADMKLKAMRQHLREIHVEDEVERELKRTSSLGNRIASLFTRIEAR